jgi:hypothetical protein
MSYRIAGIDVHKKMLAVVVSDVEIDSEYQFERRKFSSNPNNCDRWRRGCSSKRPKKSSWNRRLNGNQCGKRWKDIGNQYARNEKAQGGSLEPCIWRRRYPIADDADARGISRMPNAW